MATTEILQNFGTVTALTLTHTSVADGAGRVSTAVDNTTTKVPKLHIYCRFKKATAAGTGLVKYYLARQDNHATAYTTDNLGASDAAVSTEPPNANLVGSMVTTASNSISFYCDFVIDDPGPSWGICFWNASGAAASATSTDCFVHYIAVDPQIQA